MIRIDLHLHSDVSDGYYGPTTAADKAWAAGVRYAALADHRSIDGLEIFDAVFSRNGGVALNGVELHVLHEGAEVHLLAYGFNRDDAALKRMLKETPEIAGAIDIVHAAGGIAVLAHPLVISRDPDVLDTLLGEMRSLGLDGVEAVYATYSADERAFLTALADKHGLVVSGGSDFHGPAFPAVASPGVEIDEARWKRFRDALPSLAARAVPAGAQAHTEPPHHSNTWFLLHILLPSLAAAVLFIVSLFGAVIPSIEENLMARKREMIAELTNSAWSVLAAYDEDVKNGRMTLAAAQADAAKKIERLRYGPEEKDYFWITDTVPCMVMHPWRRDLNGKDLSDFRDPSGVRLFVEFVNVVSARDHGYVDYVWQWKDDPERLVPKESYVRLFRPWGWVIGTGIYIEDVKSEIDAITRRMIDLTAAILIVIGAMLAYVIHQSYKLERRRRRVESDLRASHARYRMLVEASSEGTLMTVESRCAYANKVLLDMIGYSESELPLLDVGDLFRDPSFSRSLGGDRAPSRFQATLTGKSGHVIETLVTPTRIEIFGKRGWILVLRRSDGAGNPSAVEAGPSAPGGPAINAPLPAAMKPAISLMLDAGVPVRDITETITRSSGALLARIIECRIAEQGPPPAKFAFLAFGSEGRAERTLVSDQDNGIVYEDVTADRATAARAYFTKLGANVCSDLNRAGFSYCKGESMARNPKWCAPLAEWKRHFLSWIREPNPDELLRFNIFFDFRPAFGCETLAAELHGHIVDLLAQSPPFFFHLARNALTYTLPLNLFGKLVTEDPVGDADRIDLKDVMLPIVNFARLYALRHGIEETHTLDRISALAAKGLLVEDDLASLSASYEFIMRMRLRHQIDPEIFEARPDNLVAPNLFRAEDREKLQRSISALSILRERIARDFPAAVGE